MILNVQDIYHGIQKWQLDLQICWLVRGINISWTGISHLMYQQFLNSFQTSVRTFSGGACLKV